MTSTEMLDSLPELGADDREVLAHTSYGSVRGPGSSPALVLVDFQHAYLGRDVPILQQLDEYPAGGGARAWAAMRTAAAVYRSARARRLPVVFTRIEYEPGEAQESFFTAKRGAPDMLLRGGEGTRFCEELAPGDGDQVVVKKSASAFHGTGLAEHLDGLGVDTVLLAGLTTSGCVRATAVDAVSCGYRVGVIRDATADRIDLSHRVSLFDLWMKYADIVEASWVVDAFDRHG